MEPLRETEPVPEVPRETVEPLREVVDPLREAVDPLREVVPVERTEEVAVREPGAAERETLVRPVEERRTAPVLPLAKLPPARVRPLRDEPPREA